MYYQFLPGLKFWAYATWVTNPPTRYTYFYYMKNRMYWLLALLAFTGVAKAQPDFPYHIQLQARTIQGLPGLHSFAVGQTTQHWLLFGGRRDGIHARQPFNAFPATQANSQGFVVDPQTDTAYAFSLSSLPTAIQEQLSSTNPLFLQDGDYLLFVGGYGFSAISNQYLTYGSLLRIHLPNLLQAVQQGQTLVPHIERLVDTAFALTGGQMGKLGGDYLLVGGHFFAGRYNPMGPNNGPGFTQRYSNQIRKFKLSAPGMPLQISSYSTLTDATHLHRRDYNLLPQTFAGNQPGYMISSGVFQYTADLPYLYPVDITAEGITPRQNFEQKLSHYHSARVAMYHAASGVNHNLFLGGLSQYYFDTAGQLLQDNNVPFVHTISRVSRDAQNNLFELVQPEQMPVRVGASAEFVVNPALPQLPSEQILLPAQPTDTLLLGHIVGGIVSPVPNAFTQNNTGVTAASAQVYAVRLIPAAQSTGLALDQMPKPYRMRVLPNPSKGKFEVEFALETLVPVHYVVTSADGRLLEKGKLSDLEVGENQVSFDYRGQKLPWVQVTLVFNGNQSLTEKVIIR